MDMNKYGNYLVHWSKANHKYINKKIVNGKTRYYYNKDEDDRKKDPFDIDGYIEKSDETINRTKQKIAEKTAIFAAVKQLIKKYVSKPVNEFVDNYHKNLTSYFMERIEENNKKGK